MITRTTRTSAFLGPAWHLPVRSGIFARGFRPLFDEGEGDEGTGGEGGGEGEGEGEGAAESIAFDAKDDNAVISIGGQKVKVSDLKTAISSRDSYAAGMKTLGQIATALKTAQAGKGKAAAGTGDKGAEGGSGKIDADTKDALKDLEKMDLLDGKTAAGIMRELRDGTINPLTKAVIAMAKEVTALKGHVSNTLSKDTEADFDREINAAISTLGLPRLGNAAIEGEDVLKEMVRDIVLSYEKEDQPKLKGEVLSKIVKERHTAIMKYARAHMKAEGEAAKQRAKAKFMKPGGQPATGGKPGRKMLSNRNLADILFQGSGQDA